MTSHERDDNQPAHGVHEQSRGAPGLSSVIVTFVDLHDRLVRNLHECALALTIVIHDHDDRNRETLTTALDVLDRAIRDIRTTAFAARQHTHATVADATDTRRRYLVRIEDEVLIAYADGDGHDFRRVHDNTIWAHESDGTLLSARSGTPIARRSGLIYYDIVNAIPLYYQAPK